MKETLNNEPSVTGRGTSVLVPFLVGGIVGAGIALLLAPKSGKELRGDIKGVAESAADSMTSAVARTKNLYDESKAAIKTAIDAGRSAYGEERDRHRQAA